MQKSSFPFQKQILKAVVDQQRKVARYLNARTARWGRRRQIFFLALTSLLFLIALTGVLTTAFIRPRTLPQIRQPPVRINIDSLQHLSPPKSIK